MLTCFFLQYPSICRTLLCPSQWLVDLTFLELWDSSCSWPGASAGSPQVCITPAAKIWRFHQVESGKWWPLWPLPENTCVYIYYIYIIYCEIPTKSHPKKNVHLAQQKKSFTSKARCEATIGNPKHITCVGLPRFCEELSCEPRKK